MLIGKVLAEKRNKCGNNVFKLKVPLVTCILLSYTKTKAYLSFYPLESHKCRVTLIMKHIWT